MTDYQIKDRLNVATNVGDEYTATVNTENNKATFAPTENATRYAYFGIATIDKNGTLYHLDEEPVDITAGDKLCKILQYGTENIETLKYKFLWAVEPAYDVAKNRYIYLTHSDFAAENDGNTDVILEDETTPKITNIKIFRVTLNEELQELLDDTQTTNDDIITYIKNNAADNGKVTNVTKTYHDSIAADGSEYEKTALSSDNVNQYLITTREANDEEKEQYPGIEKKIDSYKGKLYSATTEGTLGSEITTNTFNGTLLKDIVYQDITFEGTHYISSGSAQGAPYAKINETVTLDKGLTNEIAQGELTVLDENLKIEDDTTLYESDVYGDTITVDALAAAGAGNDVVYGTDGNDWINAGPDADTIFGGESGRDVLSGYSAEQDEGDLIIAGKKVAKNDENADLVLTLGNDKIGVQLNTEEVEIYGSDGADTIYGSKGGNNIDSHKGNDKIYLAGGTNTIKLDDALPDDNKIIYGATASDTIFLPKAALEVLQFNRSGKDLVIKDTRPAGNTFGSVKLTDFFATENKLDNFYVLNEAGDGYDGPYKISDQYITVSFDGNKPVNYQANTGFKEIIIGSTQNDTITDGTKDDIIYTNGGTDIINLKNGGTNTVLVNNNSSATVNIESGINEITAYDGNDRFNIKGGTNSIDGGNGKNTYTVTGGENNTITGGNGTDTFTISYGTNDSIIGGEGADVFTVSGKNGNGGPAVVGDSIFGGEGNDRITIYNGVGLYIETGLGDNTVNISGGADNAIYTENGNNTFSVSNGAEYTIETKEGNDKFIITGGRDNEYNAGNGENIFTVSGGSFDTILGGDGKDTFTISGYANFDSIIGAQGDDIYTVKNGSCNEFIAGDGNNTFNILNGQNDYTAGEGNNTFNISAGKNKINTGDGNNTFNILGGEDTITAGNGKTTATITNGKNKLTAGTNTDTIIIKGGNNTVETSLANDTITISGGNNKIAAEAGSDIINITGGYNEINMVNNDGVDKITGASNKDSIITTDDFSNLTFTRQDNSLNIISGEVDATANTTLIDFFTAKNKLDKIVANGETKSILNDTEITVGYTDTTKKLFIGTEYNEKLNIGNDSATITMGKGKNTVILNNEYTGLTTITLTAGEILTIKDDAMKDIEHADETHKVEARQVVGSKDLELTITNGASVGRIILKNAYGETGSTVNFDNGGENLIAFYDMVEGFKVDASYAQANNGIVKGSDISESFDMRTFVSETNKGVTLTSGSGDDSVRGSNYNDVVTIKSGNNTVEETAGYNVVKTGAGDDSFKANAGTSTNNANLGEGNNKAVLENSGTNRITSGKGKDIVEIQNDGTNILNIGAGENEITIAANSTATNNITSGKDKDVYTIGANTGENIIKSGAGSDEFTIQGGVNKIIAAGAKTDSATVNIQGGTNNIKTGISFDKYNITGGTNTIDSGAGVDVFEIKTSASTNTIKAGADNDRLTIDTKSTNIIDMGAGNDRIDITDTQGTGELSNNNINLGAGNDYIWVRANSINNIDLGAGNDDVCVDTGTNIINAGAGNDFIWLDGGTNTAFGGAGDDFFRVDGGVNTIFGGAGMDEYQVSGFNFENSITITDTQGISSFDLPKTGSYRFSFFANLTNITSATSYTLNGYTITKDTLEAGEITGFNPNTISVDLGKNKQANIYYDNEIGNVPCDLNKLASDVASWIAGKDQGYTSVDNVLASADANEFLQTFAADIYNQPV